MKESELEVKLWSLADAITAFGVLQSIAFMYAATKENIGLLATEFGRRGVLGGGALCVLAYCAAVIWCYFLVAKLGIEHRDIWKQVTIGRIVALLFFQILAAATLWAVPRLHP